MNRKNGHQALKRRRRRHRRRLAGVKSVSAGILLSGFLLMGAGKAIGNNLTMVPAVLSQEQSENEIHKIKEQPIQAIPFEDKTGPAENTSAFRADDWRLTLVNPWSTLPDGYEVTLTQLKNGHAVDERCYPDLQKMIDDCRSAGLSPVICSSYRTQEKQEALFNNKVNSLLAQGLPLTEARTEAGKAVAVPGTSEHQLGLAVDIVDLSNQNLDKSQEDTAVQKWLMENSWKYGFILRYPNDKSDITGIIYEPWHYRYVGMDAAKEINELGICLEEYLQQRVSEM